ncbi:MAG: hypothetical protein Q7U74_04990, partial [Saprospiraceae bacterium]|nr:hypothetical protein [Saprospiraceae bacterium]
EILRDYTTRVALIQPERDALEARLIKQDWQLHAQAAEYSATVENRRAYSAAYFAEASACEKQWLERVKTAPVRKSTAFYYQIAWNQFNREAKIG